MKCQVERVCALGLLLIGCHAGGETPAPAKPVECSEGSTVNPLVDLDMRRHLSQLTAANTEPGAWVTAGRDFVRVARTHAEPSYYAQSEACARGALERSPSDAGALQLMGLTLLNQHRFREAQVLANDMLSQHPEDAVSWGTLSDAELELGHVDAAIAAGQAMMDRKPNLPSYGRAAHLRWLQGDREGAKRVYEQAIASGREQKDHEPSAWMIVQAAWVFWHEGDYAGAAAGFELALHTLPEYPPALEGKGRAALAQADYRAAIGLLQRAYNAHPLVETAWWLGDAYTLAGDALAARAAYEHVTRDGARLDPRTLAAFYATKAREPAQALRLARAAYAERQDIYSKDVLAFALYRNAELNEALPLAREAIALGTPDARLLFHAGLIEAAAGDETAGRALMKRALTLNPRFDPLLLGAMHATLTAQL
jgi:tetratricopeptide (TPR) repeat protein